MSVKEEDGRTRLTASECAVVDLLRSLDDRYAKLTKSHRLVLKKLIAAGQITVAVDLFLQPFTEYAIPSNRIMVTERSHSLAFIGG